MDASRRLFLRGAGTVTLGLAALPAAQAAPAGDARAHWAMVIDTRKCIGCQACTVACAMENGVAEDAFRTVASVFEIREGSRTGAAMLPRLCNHCEEPPCIPVCPVGATYKRADGAVLVDSERCVGCAYCVQACPYEARYIHPETGTADKCTFCMHRVDAGLLPACVESCVGGARVFGDLNDPASQVARLAAKLKLKVLKPEAGSRPQVFYAGLHARLHGRVQGQGALLDPLA